MAFLKPNWSTLMYVTLEILREILFSVLKLFSLDVQYSLVSVVDDSMKVALGHS